MKAYDRGKPLFSLHIPKCAGTSIKTILQDWFGDGLRLHYYNEQLNRMPPRYRLKGGICIHGHFNKDRKLGILDYYPEADQLITILREPFEIEISLYFFLKGRKESTFRNGKPTPLQAQNLAAFLKGRTSYLFKHVPYEVTLDNYQEILERYFVYIGIAEDLQTSVNVLASKLGFAPVEIGRLNVSQHDEEVPGGLREEYVSKHPLEYAIYHYALDHYKR